MSAALTIHVTDGYEACDNCGHTIRRGWKVNDESPQGLICGKCCEECGLEPTALVLRDDE
jgi:hypothetical protein